MMLFSELLIPHDLSAHQRHATRRYLDTKLGYSIISPQVSNNQPIWMSLSATKSPTYETEQRAGVCDFLSVLVLA